MNIAFVIYHNMTALDFVGLYDPMTRLKTMGFIPELSWEICAYSETVKDSSGLGFVPTLIQPPLNSFDIVFVPGGVTTLVRQLMQDAQFIEWLKTSQNCQLKASVCTGSLLFAAAGFLQNKKATTHPNAFNELEKFGIQTVNQRIVDEGEVVTARGVTSSIDLGLYLCEKLAGYEVKEKIRRQMDYPYGIERSEL